MIILVERNLVMRDVLKCVLLYVTDYMYIIPVEVLPCVQYRKIDIKYCKLWHGQKTILLSAIMDLRTHQNAIFCTV